MPAADVVVEHCAPAAPRSPNENEPPVLQQHKVRQG